MNDESYSEYIRSILGYPNGYNIPNSNSIYNKMYSNDMFESNMYNDDYNSNAEYTIKSHNNKELEDCYPEIYTIIYPMVKKACNRNTKPITKELIDEMTSEIYFNIENNSNEINVNINLQNEVSNRSVNDRSINNNSFKKENTLNNNSIRAEDKKENRGENLRENRQFKNRGLSDLIRILLIRELLGRPGFPGNRPPRPPMRPPFPGGPGGRPPMMPRYYDDMDIYER